MDYIFVSDENLLSDVEILLSDTASRIETCEDVYTSGEVHKPLITAPPQIMYILFLTRTAVESSMNFTI